MKGETRMNAFSRVLLDEWLTRPRGLVTKIALKDGSINYQVEVPGYEKEKLRVHTVDGWLVITGEREDGQKLRYEEHLGRDFITTAKLRNGLLTINVKAAEKKGIDINIEE
jgi:HSP20 family molecular chaperone IbpA